MTPTDSAFSHCHHCGTPYPPGADFPKSCSSCAQTHYRNPVPVFVALVPCEDGLLGVERGIEPQIGKNAFPGGFGEVGETGEVGAARELFEEVGIQIDPKSFQYLGSAFNARGNLMLFYYAAIDPIPMPTLVPNREVKSLCVIRPGAELAFPLHQEASEQWFERFGPRYSARPKR